MHLASQVPPSLEAVEHDLVPKVWRGSMVLSHFATRAISSIKVGPIISSRVLLLVTWKFLPHITPDRSDRNHSLGQQRRLDNELAHPSQAPNNPVMSVMAITQQYTVHVKEIAKKDGIQFGCGLSMWVTN